LKKPEGKLRLLYESAPLAFLMEQAGGRASTGTQNLLDVVPEALHSRTPLIVGSKEDVALVESFIQEGVRQSEKAVMANS
jgi:fructose-1,6-bisphosphatase I